MTSKHLLYIGIDPGHSGWGVAIWRGDNKLNIHPNGLSNLFTFITGKERPKVIGCPELVAAIDNHFRFEPVYQNEMDTIDLIIGVESPVISSTKLLNVVKVVNQDIGYIAHAFKEDTVITLIPSDWKMFLKTSGMVPGMTGNATAAGGKKTASYTDVINRHFNTHLSHDECAAWGICTYLIWNVEVNDDE